MSSLGEPAVLSQQRPEGHDSKLELLQAVILISY